MLFHIVMEVNLPPDMPPDQSDELKAREREYSQKLQRDGRFEVGRMHGRARADRIRA